MAGDKGWLIVLVLCGCVGMSLQRCTDAHGCNTHATIQTCSSGNFVCQADEFCEISTHEHGGTHGSHNQAVHHLNCRPNSARTDCLASYALNDPSCTTDSADLTCHWCCDDTACIAGLATGVYTPPNVATNPPAVMTQQPTSASAATAAITETTTTTTTGAPGTMAAGTTLAPLRTSSPPATTTTTPPPSTTIPANGCSDAYNGDCSADFGTRCDEILVQQLCASTCNQCSGRSL
ncbi:hypothetical protein BaRGS_00039452 [Batillaria attramentaria]|uniref:ShKT domain-containing protein n=1 Tax=Batillaria attramentaria TaxID=370345 RepID=A0ABD0J311_9CAEN